MPELKLGKQTIGTGHRCYAIAEIGLNHNGRFDLAKKMVDLAAEAGFDAVKTQRRDLRTLYRPGVLDETEAVEKGVQYIMPFLKRFQLPDRELIRLKEYAEAQGLDFLCTPFDLESARHLVEDVGMRILKVASADMVNLPFLDRLLEYRLPLLISTGMSIESEVEASYSFLRDRGADFAFFHCNSNYPAPFSQINLNYMLKMKERFNIPVGYSGHELGIAVSVAAVAIGADMLERHITLDRTMEGPDHAASLESPGFIKLMRDVRNVEMAMGSDERSLSRGEVMNRQVLGKSLVAKDDLEAGKVIDASDIGFMSPGDGLSPQKYFDLVGVTISRDIGEGIPFLSSDLVGTDRESVSGVSFDYGAIARWHDLDFLLENFNPTILEVHLTAADMEHRPALTAPVSQELVLHMPEHFGNLLLDLCSADEVHRKWSVERVREAAALMVELAPLFAGTPDRPRMVVHPGAMSVDKSLGEGEIGVLRDQIQRSLDDLEGLEAEIMLENLPPFPWYLGGQWFTNYALNAAQMEEIIRGRDLGITFDTSHAQLYCNWSGADLAVELEAALPITRHLHVSDASGVDGEGLQIGRGNISWAQVAPLLFDSGLAILPEVWLGHLHGMAGMNEALIELQQLWQGLQK